MGLFNMLNKSKTKFENKEHPNKGIPKNEDALEPVHMDLSLTEVLYNSNDYAARNILAENNKDTLNILDTDSIPDCKYKYMDNVITMNVINYISTIGKESFRNCDSLQSFTIIPPLDNLIIDDFAFCEDRNLTYFNCPNITFLRLGRSAFSGCHSLKSIILNGLKEIEENTFLLNTSLDKVDIQTVTSIKNGAFQQCNSLKHIDFSNNLKNIDSFAFCNCDLEELTFPSSLQFIGGYAFEDNFNLVHVYFEHTNDDNIELGSNIFNHCKNVIIHTDNDYIYNYCKENDYNVVR